MSAKQNELDSRFMNPAPKFWTAKQPGLLQVPWLLKAASVSTMAEPVRSSDKNRFATEGVWEDR